MTLLRRLVAVILAISIVTYVLSREVGAQSQPNFQSYIQYPAGGRMATAVAHADFDLDGTLDLAVCLAGNDPITSQDVVVVLRGNPAKKGTFLPAQEFDPEFSMSDTDPVAVAVIDIDGMAGGQHYPDLVVAHRVANKVAIHLNPGLGPSSAMSLDFSPMAPLSLAVGRFNNDSLDDLAVGLGGQQGPNVRIFRGTGTGLGPVNK